LARRQTTVYLSNEVLALLDERAARTGRSRSDLIRAAVERDVAADRDALIDAAIVAGYKRIPQSEIDPWADAAAARSIAAEPS
jgi:metal-responsive CopG/Arc/MetJ family transcriptional regulator